jgi:hypothetical protein
MLVGALIAIMIAIVVGVNLIPMTLEAVEQQAEASKEPLPESVSGLMDILVYVYVAVIILGAVAWIGGAEDISLPSFSRRKGDSEKQESTEGTSLIPWIGAHRKLLMASTAAFLFILIAISLMNM